MMIKKSFWSLLIVGAIFIGGAALRFYDLEEESLWQDEAFSALFVRNPITSIANGTTQDKANPPLYYLLLAVWTHTFGESEFHLRFLSAVAGSLTVLAVYYVSRRWMRGTRFSHGPLVAMILAAIHIELIRFSQEARSYSLFILLATLHVGVFLELLYSGFHRKEEKTSTSLQQWLLLLALVLIGILGIYTHFGFWPVLGAETFFVLLSLKNGGGRNILIFLAAQGLIAASFLYWFFISTLPRVLQNPNLNPWQKSLSLKATLFTINKFFFVINPSWNEAWASAGLAILLLIFLWRFIRRKVRSIKEMESGAKPLSTFTAEDLFLFFALLGVVTFGYYAMTGTFSKRYTYFLIPIAVLLLGWFFGQRRLRWSLLFLIALMIVNFPNVLRYYRQNQKPEWRQTLEIVNAIPEHGGLIVASKKSSKGPIQFYTNSTIPNAVYNEIPPEDRALLAEKFKSLPWVAVIYKSRKDRKQILKKAAKDVFPFSKQWKKKDIELTIFSRKRLNPQR